MAVFRSTNNGESWDRYTLSTTDGAVYSIAVNPADANTVYAGGSYQTGTGRKAGMFRSINRGADWIEIGDAITASVIRFVGIDPHQTNRIYAGTDIGLFISADGGGSWEASSLNQWINGIVFDTAVPSRLFAGTSNGVYQSLDGGESWDEMNNGLVNTDVQSMDFDAVNGILYAGTNGGGVFRYTVSTNVEEEIIRDAAPSGFALYQNFPTPSTRKRALFSILTSPVPRLLLYTTCRAEPCAGLQTACLLRAGMRRFGMEMMKKDR